MNENRKQQFYLPKKKLSYTVQIFRLLQVLKYIKQTENRNTNFVKCTDLKLLTHLVQQT